MSLVFVAQYIAFALSVPMAAVVGYRAYRHRDHERNMPVVWLSSGMLLIAIAQGTALLAAYFLWVHLITSFTIYAGFLLVYWGLRNLLYREPLQETLTRSAIFKVFLVLSTIAIALNVGRVLTWIPTDKESSLHYPIELNVWPPFYWGFNTAFYFANDFIQFIFLVLIIVTYAQTFHLYKNTAYLIRRILCSIGFFVATIGLGAILVRIILWALGDDSQSITLIRIYQNTKAIGFIIILLGFLMPHRVFTWVTAPLEYIKACVKKQQYDLLLYLHTKIVQITPSVRLQLGTLSEARVLVEISDARQFILSYVEQLHPMTAEEEAQRIMELLRSGEVIDTPGPHIPPKIKIQSVLKHHCAIARHLKRLENGE